MNSTWMILALGSANFLVAQPLTQSERDRSMSELHASRKQVLDVLASLSPGQLAFKPSPERWSVAEVAEHLILTEDMVDGMIRQSLTKPAAAPSNPAMDAKLLTSLPDRSKKFAAPEPARPSGRWKTRESLTAEFKTRRDRTIGFVNKTQEGLRAHGAAHPAFGMIDTYQWTLFLAGHASRHVLQMREVIADPKFPR